MHVGGASGDILNPIALSSTEIYDDISKTWLAGPPMAQARAGFSISHTPTGQIQILGGASADPPAAQNGTEWYYR